MRVNEMVLGLVRCAELREQDGGGDLWDDASRLALAEARARGWGKGRTGDLSEGKSARRCIEHGGVGFVSDCIVCLGQEKEPRE
jgi:hypothetical protein